MGRSASPAARRGKGEGVRRGAFTPSWKLLAVFLGPAFALYTTFVAYPLFSALQYSLFRWNGPQRLGFTGLGNFVELFTRYPINQQVLAAFWHNCAFFVGTMLVQNTVGLAFAVLLYRSRLAKRFLQTAYTLPHLVSPLVVGYLWSLMLSPTFGVVNTALRAVGLDQLAQPWLGSTDTALWVVILVKAWQWIGFPMLLFSAALAGIPEEYDQAARVDGASPWQAFRRVTLPLLVPALGLVGVLTFIGSFNVFDIVFALEGQTGAPAGSTDVLGLLFYRLAFSSHAPNHIGLSSALAVLMFVFIFGTSLLANRYLRKWEARLR